MQSRQCHIVTDDYGGYEICTKSSVTPGRCVDHQGILKDCIECLQLGHDPYPATWDDEMCETHTRLKSGMGYCDPDFSYPRL